MNPHFFTAPCLFSDDRLFFCDAYFSGIGLGTGRGLSDIEDHALIAGGECELLLFFERAVELAQDTSCLLQLLFRTGAFHGTEDAADLDEGHRPL